MDSLDAGCAKAVVGIGAGRDLDDADLQLLGGIGLGHVDATLALGPGILPDAEGDTDHDRYLVLPDLKSSSIVLTRWTTAGGVTERRFTTSATSAPFIGP